MLVRKISPWVLLALLVCPSASSAQAITPVFELQFDRDSAYPGSYTYDSFGDVAVDRLGNVAMRARGDLGSGILARINGEILVIAETEQNALIPDSRGILSPIRDVDDHVEIIDGKVVFKSRGVTNADSDREEAVVLWKNRELSVIYRENDPPPLVPFDPSAFFSSVSDAESFGYDGSRLAFSTFYRQGGVSFEGAFLAANGDLTTLLLDNDSTAFGTITSVDDVMPDANGPGIVMDVVAGGDLYTLVYESGTFNAVLSENDLMPGNRIAEGSSEPDIDAGRVVSSVSLKDGTEGIYLFDDGAVTEIIHSTTVLPEGDVSALYGSAVAIAGEFVAFNADVNGTARQYVWRNGVISHIAGPGMVIDGMVVSDVKRSNRPVLSDGYLAVVLEMDEGGGVLKDAVYRVDLLSPQERAAREAKAVSTLSLTGLAMLVLLLLGAARGHHRAR